MIRAQHWTVVFVWFEYRMACTLIISFQHLWRIYWVIPYNRYLITTLFFKRNATFLNPFFPVTLGHWPWPRAMYILLNGPESNLQKPRTQTSENCKITVDNFEQVFCTLLPRALAKWNTQQSSSIYTLPKKKGNFPRCVSFETECTLTENELKDLLIWWGCVPLDWNVVKHWHLDLFSLEMELPRNKCSHPLSIQKVKYTRSLVECVPLFETFD